MRYSTIAGDLLPDLLGAPDPLLERAVRDSVIDFCLKTMVYRVENDPATLAAETKLVDLEIPNKTRLQKVLAVRLGHTDLPGLTRGDLDRMGNWDELEGRPLGYTVESDTEIRLVPSVDGLPQRYRPSWSYQ